MRTATAQAGAELRTHQQVTSTTSDLGIVAQAGGSCQALPDDDREETK